MSKYRNDLPQTRDEIFLTDGGLETTLLFHEGIDLPGFATFPLFYDEKAVAVMREYYRKHARLAQASEFGFILESATWRTNADWGAKLGYTPEKLADANRRAIALLAEVRSEFESAKTKIVISGCVGPRGDGYVPSHLMSAKEAQEYHSAQIQTFAETEADMISAMTLNYVEEAVGIARAARFFGMPCAISFTVETDGKLAGGESLKAAIEAVDRATGSAPAYYMINCAHPTHFAGVLKNGEAWTERIRGVRANASRKSHAELDESTELDTGNPQELGGQYCEMLENLKNLTVLGGCCGTDFRHIEAICNAVKGGMKDEG
jgi:S-methylmethionine-dependent homocysteine/selenocysteine methylase